MPLHAVCSTVRPASFLYGAGAGYGGPNAMSFPQYVLLEEAPSTYNMSAFQVARAKFETKQTESTVGRRPDPYAVESIRRQERDKAVISPGAIPSHRGTAY
jgi:hypothetical protein